MATPLLSLQNLHVSVEGTEIVRGVDLTINEGEVHAIMGPNGSGKSTLVNALMGHPAYEITHGSATFMGQDLSSMEPHERSIAGLFLAFQYPKEIAGVTLRSFLLAAHRAHAEKKEGIRRLSPLQFDEYLQSIMETLHMNPAFADRFINQGFSGGEKKKAEILQMTVLQPRLALMDETDSGLDVDALKIVAEGVQQLRVTRHASRVTGVADAGLALQDEHATDTGPFSALIVTHYARILEYLQPDFVHVMVKGKIVESGGADLAHRLEKEGYVRFGGGDGMKIGLDG